MLWFAWPGFLGVTDAAGGFNMRAFHLAATRPKASATGFITQTLPVVIQATGTAQLSFLLATAFADVNFTLVWGAQPPDLDAHLSGPASGGGRFHAFFLNQNPETYVSLIGESETGWPGADCGSPRSEHRPVRAW